LRVDFGSCGNPISNFYGKISIFLLILRKVAKNRSHLRHAIFQYLPHIFFWLCNNRALKSIDLGTKKSWALKSIDLGT
jgi:hypothetical protein